MKFIEIKIKDLDKFINSNLYNSSKNLPITQQRAISQLNNPRANKEDIALIIAVDKSEQIIGFIGSLPDKLHQYPEISFSWNSCWWVDPKNGKQTAIPLLLKFLKIWKNNVAFRDMSLKTKQIILRLNKFKTIKNLNGFRYFLKLNSATIFPKKNKLLIIFKPLFFIFDILFNFIISFKYKKKSNFFNVKYITSIDDEAEIFINKLNKNELFRRGKTELNWILKYPWVTNKSKNKSQFYYFSDASKKFNNHLVKVYNNSFKLIGVLFLTNQNGLIKIPYAYFKKEDVTIIIQYIFEFLKTEKAISFLTFNTIINNEIQTKNNPFWLKKQHNKELVISKDLLQYLNQNFDFQDGEGDFIFT